MVSLEDNTINKMEIYMPELFVVASFVRTNVGNKLNANTQGRSWINWSNG
jgi:hypothetical protein